MKKNTLILSLSLIAALGASQAFASMTVYHCNGMDGSSDVTLTVGNAHLPSK